MTAEWLREYVRPSEPKPHSLTSTIGFCPECKTVHIHDDIGKLVEAKGISAKLREKFPGQIYVCKSCGVPLAETKEEALKLDECWFCGGREAVTRDKFEASRGFKK